MRPSGNVTDAGLERHIGVYSRLESGSVNVNNGTSGRPITDIDVCQPLPSSIQPEPCG
jgi:hypothetical protein